MSKVGSFAKIAFLGGFVTTFVTSVLIIGLLIGSIVAFLHGYVLYRYYECLVMPWFGNAPKLPYAAFVCFVTVKGLIFYKIHVADKEAKGSWVTMLDVLTMPIMFLFTGWLMTQLINYFCETSLVFSL